MATSKPPTPDSSHYKVLVPTDFSDNSRRAVEYALQIFQHRLTHLLILHAYRDPAPNAEPMVSLLDILREKSERLLQKELRFISTLPQQAGLKIQIFSKFESIVPAICDLAEAEDIDLVILGTNGHTHPRLDMRDDDPSYILHRLNRPILLVPKLLN